MFTLMRDGIYDTLFIIEEFEEYCTIKESEVLDCPDEVVYRGTYDECLEIMRGE